MKTFAPAFFLMTATLTTACAWLPSSDRDDYPTVGELAHNEVTASAAIDARDSRAAAIRHYRAFLDETSDSGLAAEAVRRLADLHLELEQDALLQPEVSATGEESRAAELYAELLQRFPDHGRNDSALYQLARAHEQRGDIEPAMAALTEYASRYPSGERYDEAQFRRGEYLFMHRDYAQAEAAYAAVLDQDEASDFDAHALYKLGWSRFKQNRYQRALDAFVRLLDETIGEHDSAVVPGNLAAPEQERLDDSLRAVSLSFSHLGGPRAISGYFRTRGARPYESLLYAKLAALYLGKERFTDAAETYRLFAEFHPDHRDAPLFQSRVIDVYTQAGFSEQVLTQKQAFVRLYQPASDYWKRHDPAGSHEVLLQVQRHLRDVAQHYHALAQSRGTPASIRDAGHWYRLFLDAFADSEQAPYMNFLYAELLDSAGQHARAAVQYERTAYGYGSHEKAAEAGYAALLAYQRHEATLEGAQRAGWHRDAIDSALHFAEEFPRHPQALSVLTRAAQQLYELQDHGRASATAERVAANPEAKPELRLSAWMVIAHAQFELQDYQRAEAACQQVLASEGRMSAQQRQAFRDKLAASIYKQGERARERGDIAQAARHFLRVGDAVPASAMNVTAQYDAAAAYMALDQRPEAIAILERWRRSYPNDALGTDVTRKLAVLYRKNNQPQLAAAEFARLADTENDPLLRREACWTAAQLYQETAQHARAIDAYRRFVEQFPEPVEQAMEARLQLVVLHEATGRSRMQRYWQQQIVDADRQAGPRRTDRTRYLAAHARLALATEDLQGYRKVRLVEPLQTNLAMKKELMQAAIAGLRQAAAYEVSGVTTESTFRIGELYADFAKALMQSERPANLSAEELAQYKILLEEQVYPFEEKAIDVHEANVQRIASGVYDDWVKESMAALAELMPVRYAKQEEGESFVAILP
ncbi:MAG: tetratricopeptide repeat protein [Gammaproteobacteria bacterium]